MSDLAHQAEAPAQSAGRAKKSSFYLAMRILPRAQRQAMYEVYSFCRLVDDIADEGGTRAERHAGLQAWRRDIDALYAGRLPRADLADLAAAIRNFGLKREDFLAVIDGMDMDVEEAIQAPDWAKLTLYCDRVASAVGRLSVCVFGTPEAERQPLADHLGKALQLTNILRDIDEDAAIDRLYLPKEALERAGIVARAPRLVAADPRLPAACAEVVAAAQAHFEAAKTTMDRCPRASVRAPRIMYQAYHELLRRTVAQGFDPPRTRVGVSKSGFLLSLLRYGLL